MSLRIAYVSNGLTGHRLEEALRLLADSGYDGVALTLDHVHLDPFAADLVPRVAALGRLLGDLELSCVVETGGRFVLDPRRKHFPTLLSRGRERRLDFLRRAVEIASGLEAPVVSLWSGAPPEGVDPAVAWERLLDGCDRLLDHAGRHGVALGFEPEPGMLVATLADWERLGDRLGAPAGLGLTLDLGHCVCLEPRPVADCVRRAGPQLVHVHVEDMRRGEHEHLWFGDGELELAPALGALAELGYAGQVAVELSRHAHAAHETVPAAIAILRAHEPAGVAA